MNQSKELPDMLASRAWAAQPSNAIMYAQRKDEAPSPPPSSSSSSSSS
jgi:hypothetical protein